MRKRVVEAEPPTKPEKSEASEESPETLGEKIVSKTPWWGISIAAHAVVLTILTFLIVLGTPFENEDAMVVSPPRKKREMPDMEKPRDMDRNKKVLEMKKSVEEADHNETADEEEFQKAKGDSMDFVSDKPFKGKGTYDTIGGGAGGGGRYGSRLGGKKDLVAKGGGGKDTEDAVLAALRWLARHQNSDGSWSTRSYTKHCNKTLPNGKSFGGGDCKPNPGHTANKSGLTGLAMLAFLGAGYSHHSRDTYDGITFGDVIKKGMQWIISTQDPEGCLGGRKGMKYMYNHLLCALALSEAYGLTGSPFFKEPAQKGVDFTVAAQNKGSGWRYSYKSGDNDVSVTGWAVMVLKSAELSGLSFPQSAYEGSRSFLESMTEGSYYRVEYHPQIPDIYKHPQMRRHRLEPNDAMAAINVMSRIFMDKDKDDPALRGGCDLILRKKPEWGAKTSDFYYWYYASLALFQFDGPKGPKWRAWNEPMKNVLVKNQNAKESKCKHGSWETDGRWCTLVMGGGRVYATAINCLTLEVYYRYGNVFGGGGK